jgi:hypothetical protein
VVNGRAHKTEGHRKPMPSWSVLIRDHHPGYITWAEFEENQQMIAENAHMKKRMARKSARGGRALLTGLVRCARCARMMRVFYGMRSGRAHRYQCRGDSVHDSMAGCIGIGGVRVDQAVAAAIVEAVSPHAIEAALEAAERMARAEADRRTVLNRELEDARYEASLAARRYECVDPAKRLVARELEARWNTCLERVADLEARLRALDEGVTARPRVDREALLALAQDLPSTWNSEATSPATKQRLTRILIQEVIIDLDVDHHDTVVTIHWTGGRHTALRIPRTKSGRYPSDLHPAPVEVMRKLGGRWPDRELAVTMNRMRCKSSDGKPWTTMRARELRERLGIPAFDAASNPRQTISVDETARRLDICVQSVHRLIREGVLPATQAMHSAPWEVPLAALDTEAVRIGVRNVMARRPQNFKALQDLQTLKLPGI